ncbi:glycerophosphoryl diester phosphodiesterase membrane domain-containing protein [Terricaulis sp.]|uniref:glycerophosphoryl diester phosphodiesterase membrane domain-containing protein n=1 Tax=Terricaulis sp. TaxID=2768686 RepID=UPI0037840195
MANLAMEEARFDFGRVIGQTFGLIGRNFGLFFLMALVFAGAPQFAIQYAQSIAFSSGDPMMMTYVSLGALLASFVFTYILQGSLTRASVDDLSGKGVQFGAALGDGFRYFFPLFIVALLVGIGMMIGFILLIIPGIILAVRWVVSAPVVVVEREGPTRAIGRSAELGEGHRWAIFGLILLFVVFSYACMIVLGMVMAATLGDVGPAGIITTMDTTGLLIAGFTAVISAITTLISTVGTASLYFELRRVKDGVSVTDLASVFD